MQLSDRIKKIRTYLGLSQLVFSSTLGVSRGHISNIETGGATPSEQLLKLICEKFSINEDWLIRNEGPMESPEKHLSSPQIQKLKDDLENNTYGSFINHFNFYAASMSQIAKFLSDIRGQEETKRFQIHKKHKLYNQLIDSYEGCLNNVNKIENELKQLFAELNTNDRN